MNVIETELPGVLIFETRVFRDERGYFLESWNRERHAGSGVPEVFVQDNLSSSAKGVLRGLHYQHPRGQGKLVMVLQGEVWDVAVDIRVGSPHFGRWVGATLSSENHRQLYIPPGFAHGFVVTGENALFSYKCTDYYQPRHEGSIAWDDPAIGIEWPITSPILSAKDRDAPRLEAIAAGRLPSWEDSAVAEPSAAEAS